MVPAAGSNASLMSESVTSFVVIVTAIHLLEDSAPHLMVSCYNDLLTSKCCCLKLLLKPPAASALASGKSSIESTLMSTGTQ